MGILNIVNELLGISRAFRNATWEVLPEERGCAMKTGRFPDVVYCDLSVPNRESTKEATPQGPLPERDRYFWPNAPIGSVPNLEMSPIDLFIVVWGWGFGYAHVGEELPA